MPNLTAFGGPNMPRINAVAAGDYIAQSQFGYDPVLTGIVIGKPMPRTFLGEALFREIPTGALSVSVPILGDEHRMVRNTERALRASYQHSDRDVDRAVKRLTRHSWATLMDVDEVANQNAIATRFNQPSPNNREARARESEMVVAIGREAKRAAIATAAASYSSSSPDLDVTLVGGSEWNAASGDSRGDVQALAQTLASTNSVTIMQVEAFLSSDAYNAAINDPVYIAHLSSTSANPGSADQLASYWGIGGVTVGDAYEYDAATDSYASLYGDVCILRISRQLTALYDTTTGTGDSFVRFSWDGYAMEAWVEKMVSSWVFPWDAWELADQVDHTAAAIIRNCKA